MGAPDLLPEDIEDIENIEEWTPPPSMTPNSSLNAHGNVMTLPSLQDSAASSKPMPAPLTLQQAQKVSDEALAVHLEDAGFEMIVDNYSVDDEEVDEEEEEEDSDEVQHNEMAEINPSSDSVRDIE